MNRVKYNLEKCISCKTPSILQEIGREGVCNEEIPSDLLVELHSGKLVRDMYSVRG